MSQSARDAVLERAMQEPEFRALLASDPAAALAPYDLTEEERGAFRPSTARTERLEARMSKSDLSAAMSLKTASPLLTPPSENAKKR